MFLAASHQKCRPLLPSAGRHQQKMPTGKHCPIGPALHGRVSPALPLNLALFGVPGSLRHCSISWGLRPFFSPERGLFHAQIAKKWIRSLAPMALAFGDPDFFVHRQILKLLLRTARPPDLKALHMRQICKTKMLIRWQAPKIAAAIQYSILLTSARYQPQTRADCASVALRSREMNSKIISQTLHRTVD